MPIRVKTERTEQFSSLWLEQSDGSWKRNHLEIPLCSPMITKQEIIDECTSVKDIRDSSGKNRKIYHYFVTFMVSSIKPHSYQIVAVTLHSNFLLPICLVYACTLGVSPSLVSRCVKATVSGVVEDLKFKISEGSDPNWCFPDSVHSV